MSLTNPFFPAKSNQVHFPGDDIVKNAVVTLLLIFALIADAFIVTQLCGNAENIQSAIGYAASGLIFALLLLIWMWIKNKPER